MRAHQVWHIGITIVMMLAGLVLPQMAQADDLLYTLETVAELGGSTTALALYGDYAYVGVEASLQVVDVSDPANPTHVLTQRLGGRVLDLAIDPARGLLYVAEGEGWSSYDLTDPLAPALRIKTAVSYTATGVAVSNGLVYVLVDHYPESCVRIYDPSNPDAPALLGSACWYAFSYGLTVADGYAYVALGDGGMLTIDVTTPASPQVLDTYSEGHFIERMTVANGYLYVAMPYHGLRIMDLTDRAHPTPRGKYDSASSDVAVVGNVAYAAASDGVHAVDVSDPDAPQWVGQGFGPQAPLLLALAGQRLCVATESGALEVGSVTAPTSPTRQGGAYWPGMIDQVLAPQTATPSRLAIWLGLRAKPLYTYVLDGYGLWTLDLRDPTNPLLVGRLGLSSRGASLGFLDYPRYLFVAEGYGGLEMVDISDPTSLTSAVKWVPPNHGSVNDVYPFLQGDKVRAYVCATSYVYALPSAVYLLDLTDPASVQVVSVYPMGSKNLSDLTALDKMVYVAAGDALVSIDYTTASSPSAGPTMLPPTALGVAPRSAMRVELVHTDGQRLFVGSNDHNLGRNTVQLVDPSTLTGTASLAGSYRVWDIMTYGDRAGISSSGSVTVYDMLDTAEPRIIAQGDDYAQCAAYLACDGNDYVLQASNKLVVSQMMEAGVTPTATSTVVQSTPTSTPTSTAAPTSTWTLEAPTYTPTPTTTPDNLSHRVHLPLLLRQYPGG